MRACRLVLLCACLLPVAALPAVYTVRADTVTGSLNVAVVLEKPLTEFRMPAWAPGDYRIVDFGQNLDRVSFSLNGSPVEHERTEDPNMWRIPGGADKVTYIVRPMRPGLFTENMRVTPTEVLLHGPAALGYFVGDQAERQKLFVELLPGEGTRLECSLDRVEAPQGFVVMVAPNYDILIDAPMVMGTQLRVQEFTVRGVPHSVVAFGRNERANLGGYVDIGRQVAEQAHAMFGEIPSKRYVFLYDFGGPPGGLEHRDSSRMGVWPGATARAVASLISHEYFHLYNVKRIRPRNFEPFDLSRPAVTGSIWWLEGVTDYYADVLLLRAGIINRNQFINGISNENRALLNDPMRLRVSADESSRRVWESNNSSGFGIDYYLKGKLIGLCLDLAIRAETGGSRSLDDVMVALYNETKNDKPGYQEGRIRELFVQFGGEALGPVYDRCVMQAVDLPLPQLLELMGMAWDGSRIVNLDRVAPATARLRDGWPMRVSN